MKVRTTFNPDVEIEVGKAEYLDLQRQGLLVPDTNPTPPPPRPRSRGRDQDPKTNIPEEK